MMGTITELAKRIFSRRPAPAPILHSNETLGYELSWSHELPELQFFFEHVPWRSFVQLPILDVGSHHGDFALNFLRAGFHVESFEPFPNNYKLQAAKLGNYLKSGRLRMHALAASNRTGQATMDVSSADTLHSLCPEWKTIAFPGYFNAGRQMQVSTKTLGTYLRQLGCSQVFFAKMDTEGHEFEALSGLLDVGADSLFPAVVMVEINQRFKNSACDVLRLLGSKGYTKFVWCVKLGADNVVHRSVRLDATFDPALDSIRDYFYGNIFAFRPPLDAMITWMPESKMTTSDSSNQVDPILERVLVEPVSKRPLRMKGDRLETEDGASYPLIDGVPCFVQPELTEHQMSELEHTTQYVQEIREHRNPLFNPDRLYEQTETCWEWVTPWINPRSVTPDTRIVCIGGSFADDLPHVRSNYKFNVDHLAHAYVRLAPEIRNANTHYLACGSETLPFPDGFADIAYARNSLDHVCNPLATLKELFRILKPGALLCIGVYYNSDVFNEHESTSVDDDFITKAITPLFDIVSCQVDTAPQQPNVANLPTGFLHLVCKRRVTAQSTIDQRRSNDVEVILAHFHSGLYLANRGRIGASIDHFTKVLEQTPFFITDVWRLLYSLIQVCAHSSPRTFACLVEAFRGLGDCKLWNTVLAQAAERHGRVSPLTKLTRKLRRGLRIVPTPLKTLAKGVLQAVHVLRTGGLEASPQLQATPQPTMADGTLERLLREFGNAGPMPGWRTMLYLGIAAQATGCTAMALQCVHHAARTLGQEFSRHRGAMSVDELLAIEQQLTQRAKAA